jgi:hypothetical protein
MAVVAAIVGTSLVWFVLLLVALHRNDALWSEAHRRGMTAEQLSERRRRGYQ